MPTTSPARTWSETSSTRGRVGPGTVMPATSRITSPISPVVREKSLSGSCPTICRTIHAGVGLGHVLVGDDGAVAQHGDVVADAAELVELVRDVDDRDVVTPQVAHDTEEHVDLVVGQGRGRLVHDQDAHLLQQHARDLDELLLADGQVTDEEVRVDVLTEPAEHLLRAYPLSGVVDEPSAVAKLATGEQVLGDRHVRKEAELLVDDPDTKTHGVAGAGDRDGLTLEVDLTRAGLFGAGEDLHQGRLAGAILPDQDVDLAAERLERHVLECTHAPVALGDVNRTQDDVVRGGRADGGSRLGHIAHEVAVTCVGTMSTAPGATSENAPAKSTFLPTSDFGSTLARTSVLTLSLSCVPASA